MMVSASVTRVERLTLDLDATGETDVSGPLGEWLQALPDGAKVDLGSGVLRCEAPLRLTGKRGLTLAGDATIRRTQRSTVVWPKPAPHLWLLDCQDTSVSGLRVEGTNTVADQRLGYGAYLVSYEFEAAIRAERCDGLLIEGFSADAVWGDGVQLQRVTDGTVRDVTLDRVGRQGVTLIGTHLSCERVTVGHGRRSGFDIEPDTAANGSRDIVIRDCAALTIGLPIASGGVGPADDVRITGNTFDGVSVPLVLVRSSDGTRRRNWTVTGNRDIRGRASTAAALSFTDVDGVTVDGNQINVSAKQSRRSVSFTRCGGDLSVTGNDFLSGVWVDDTTPAAGRVLTVAGNSPEQTVRAT